MATCGLSAWAAPGVAAQTSETAIVPGAVLVRFRPGVDRKRCRRLVEAATGRRARALRCPKGEAGTLLLARLPWFGSATVLARLAGDPRVVSVHPNFVYRPAGLPATPPSDPGYPRSWALENTGQPSPHRAPRPTVPGADLDWVRAIETIRAAGKTLSPVTVAVLDSGVQLDHPDLVSSLWRNPGEIPGNGIDDDQNGYVDDVFGIDTGEHDSDPSPVPQSAASWFYHGTGTAGLVGATVDNAIGATGVAPNARIMAIKISTDSGTYATTASVIEGLAYAVAKGAKVVNMSLVLGTYPDAALLQAILDADRGGVVIAASAGNLATDNDRTPWYPASYDAPNLLGVAASDRWDRLAYYSSYGHQRVAVVAPAMGTYTTNAPTGYRDFNGTSAAAPIAAGCLTVLAGLGVYSKPADLRAALVETVDPSPAYRGRSETSGRINLANAVTRALGLDTTPPAAPTGLQVLHAGPRAITIGFAASGDDGDRGAAHRYELRFAPTATWTGFAAATGAPAGWRGAPAGAAMAAAASGLAPGTSYTFQLCAFDEAGNASPLSATIEATAAAPGAAVYADDFEAGLSGWTKSTKPKKASGWGITSADASSGSRSLTDSPKGQYRNKMDASIETPPIDLTAATGPTLSFSQRYELESGFDRGTVEVSLDGASWNTLLEVTGSLRSWARVSLDLSPYAGNTIVIRFRTVTDSSVRMDGWSVDDVQVTAAGGRTVLLDEPFADLLRWDVEGDWGIDAQGRLTDSPAGRYADSLLQQARLRDPVDLTQALEAWVSFDLTQDFHQDGKPTDFLYLEASTDGATWAELGRWSGAGLSGQETIDVGAFCGLGAVHLRFLFHTDSVAGSNADGVTIDNLRVAMTGQPAPPPPPNQPPTASPDSYLGTEDIPLTVSAANGLLANDRDPEGDLLHALIVGGPAHGQLALQPDGSFTYTPSANYAGADGFTYAAADAQAQSAPTVVTLTIQAVNDAPTAASQTLKTPADAPLAITLAGADVDGDALTFAVTVQPAHGTLSGVAPSLTYQPAAGFAGTDSFTFAAVDPAGLRAEATVTIAVTSAPPPPPPTPAALATDGFESRSLTGGTGWSGPWVRLGKAELRKKGGNTGPWCVRFKRGGGSLTRSLQLAGARGLRLRLWLRSRRLTSGDALRIELVADGGAPVVVRTITQADNADAYQPLDLDLSAFDGATSLQLRFVSTLSSKKAKVLLDDVEVRGLR